MNPNAVHMTSLAPDVNIQVPPKSKSSLNPAVHQPNGGGSLPWGSIRSTAPSPGRTPATSTTKAPRLATGKWYRPTWSPINKCIAASGLVIAVLAIIATLYFGITSGPGSPADRRAIWSSHNDFRGTCISELESGLPRSPACNKVLAQPAKPPPDLEKRGGIFVSSSYLVQWIVLAFVPMAVTSATLYTATRFFGSLQLTTVIWQAFDVDERNNLGGISRTFERIPITPTPSSDIATRIPQIFTSPDRAHEYRRSSSRVLMAQMSADLIENEGVRVVDWKELCQLSKGSGLHTLKVPLLPHGYASCLSLSRRVPQQQGPDFTYTEVLSEGEYPTIYFLRHYMEESDCASICRKYLYVVLNSDLLDHPATYHPVKEHKTVPIVEVFRQYSNVTVRELHLGDFYGKDEPSRAYGRNAYKNRQD